MVPRGAPFGWRAPRSPQLLGLAGPDEPSATHAGETSRSGMLDLVNEVKGHPILCRRHYIAVLKKAWQQESATYGHAKISYRRECPRGGLRATLCRVKVQRIGRTWIKSGAGNCHV